VAFSGVRTPSLAGPLGITSRWTAGRSASATRSGSTKITFKFIRFAAYVQGMVPGHIEGQRLHRRRIARIVELPRRQHPDDDMQVLRRTPQAFIKVTARIANEKFVKKVVPKNTGPGSLLRAPTFVPEIGTAIKQFTGPPVM